MIVMRFWNAGPFRRIVCLLICAGLCMATTLPAVAATGTQRPAQASTAETVEDTVRSPGPASAETEITDDWPPVFGSRLFTGAFSKQPFAGFNPDYQIMIGDQVRVQLWGAIEFGEVLQVDAQGNIFLPKVGPVEVAGVRNDALTQVVERQVKRVYRSQVQVYANLESAQPVSVLVSGFVRRPGMYRGLSSDSVLYFIDMAGGIDLRRGSFVDVRIQRNGAVRETVNLYQFLLEGTLPAVQFSDGDAVHVGPITNIVGIEGAVNNGASFEFSGPSISATEVLAWSTPRPEATHIRVRRNNAGEVTAEFVPLTDLGAVTLKPGDRVTVIPEDRRQEIVVGISGEHGGVKEIVVPQNTKLEAILDQVVLNDRSHIEAVQLFRESVKERQRGLLQQALNRLEHEVWASRSSTDEEASLRLKEADLVQSFIDRARTLEPQGLVVLGESVTARDLYLEDGDVIFIPRKSELITVAGEVNFPTAVTWRSRMKIKEYITKAGGLTRTAEPDDVLLRRANGEIEKVGRGARPEPGDEIMVLPRPNVKNLQLGKAFAEILFQLAVTTRVVTGL